MIYEWLYNKRYVLITGCVVNLSATKLNIGILYEDRQSKLIKNTSNKIIKDIYDSDLKIEHQKFIVNKYLGIWKKSKKQRTKIFMDKYEAYDYMKNQKKFNGWMWK